MIVKVNWILIRELVWNNFVRCDSNFVDFALHDSSLIRRFNCDINTTLKWGEVAFQFLNLRRLIANREVSSPPSLEIIEDWMEKVNKQFTLKSSVRSFVAMRALSWTVNHLARRKIKVIRESSSINKVWTLLCFGRINNGKNAISYWHFNFLFLYFSLSILESINFHARSRKIKRDRWPSICLSFRINGTLGMVIRQPIHIYNISPWSGM